MPILKNTNESDITPGCHLKNKSPFDPPCLTNFSLIVDLAGKTSLDQARSDMVVECVADMIAPIDPCYRENNEDKKVRLGRLSDAIDAQRWTCPHF